MVLQFSHAKIAMGMCSVSPIAKRPTLLNSTQSASWLQDLHFAGAPRSRSQAMTLCRSSADRSSSLLMA